jgi:transketolase
MSSNVELAKQIRSTSLEMVASARASHIGSALSMADILAVLYSQILVHDVARPMMPSRDRLILSKGHGCVALYAALYHRGFITKADIDSYGADNSILMSHVSHHVSGIEFSTGSLGHGLPFATGKALYAQMRGESWRTFVILGDGELQEGSNWEAMMFASHHKIRGLHVIIDANNLQSLTTVDNTLSIEPLVDRVAAFGWEVCEVDGHDHVALTDALSIDSEKPKCVVARTIKGKGVSYMENQVAWHYKFPNQDELQTALREVIGA